MNPSQLATLLGIATFALGHGVMIEPRPYNLETAPLLQVAPLNSELVFPCQGRTDHVEKRTTLTAGTSQTVKFWISAVHGGGSCQFSVTYDYPPPADPAKWKTLYTIIGDCPAKAAGNLPTVEQDKDGRENGPQCGNDSGDECVRQFDVPIPAGIRNAENATFAFTVSILPPPPHTHSSLTFVLWNIPECLSLTRNSGSTKSVTARCT